MTAVIPNRKDSLVIENIRPLVNAGQYPLKREPGDMVTVQADIFRCSHEKYEAAIQYRLTGKKKWETAPMKFVDNDLWEGSFQVKSIGFYEYQVIAWTTAPKDEPTEEVPTESPIYEVRVDPLYARVGTWYEMFPRSQGTDPKKAGTWDDCIKRIPEIAGLGFDTIYLVPIHPIGKTNRKGANNSVKAKAGEPGCPYAVGSDKGGHYAVDPELGTLKDFDRFAKACKQAGIRLALDIALNCSPDHPYVKQHPEWYCHEADGSIKFAENPPKKYEDIYPFDYYNENYKALWQEIRDVILFWTEHGFDIFRIDNPHTKPFAFWEWMIRDIKEKKPEVVFLAEAFTRPKMMHRLAKLGFDQSYTYFTWRVEKWEIEEYFKELCQSEAKEYMRGMLFPTTPDIFPKHLHNAPASAFKMRLLLAATLSSIYGMYNGYELCENEPFPNKEELNHSEKYQYKTHDWNAPGNIKDFVSKVNRARKQQPALQEYNNLHFHTCENPQIMVYSKRIAAENSTVLCIVNLDPYNTQSGIVRIDMAELGLHDDDFYFVKDQITGENFVWRGSENFVLLDPSKTPGHLFTVLKA